MPPKRKRRRKRSSNNRKPQTGNQNNGPDISEQQPGFEQMPPNADQIQPIAEQKAGNPEEMAINPQQIGPQGPDQQPPQDLPQGLPQAQPQMPAGQQPPQTATLVQMQKHGDPKELVGYTFKRRYDITKVLGSGSFGVCYEALDRVKNRKVALKIAHESTCKENRDMIDIELAAHQIMNNTQGIPKLWDNFVERYKEFEKTEEIERYVIVIELLGPDLSKLYEKVCQKKFTWKTIFMMAYEMVIRLKSVHAEGLVHRDLKPENFLIGSEGEARKMVYLTDFGLAKRFWDEKRQQHFPPEKTKGLCGTVRYVSVNVHNGITMSRRDDLESVAYILMYFIAGSLPWDGWESTKDDQFYTSVRNKKESLHKNKFLMEMPEVIQQYFIYCRQLSYEQTPDYDQWLKMFESQCKKYNFEWDYNYDWLNQQNTANANISSNPQDIPPEQQNPQPNPQNPEIPTDPPNPEIPQNPQNPENL